MHLIQHTLHCSNCDLPIGAALVHDPEAPVSQRVRAKCPFCGDYSWEIDIPGIISFGGVAQKNPNDTREKVPDDLRDELPFTALADIVYEDDGSITFIMKKENYGADPAKCSA